jgi:hypothetical protein
MPRRKTVRSQSYRLARDLGNLEAAERGPVSYGKRYARRGIYRGVNRGLGRVMRKLGLFDR